ncbi:MAG: TetR/AcrR family transcriptional regulator [Acidimicrobiales bacterium]
MVVSRRAEYSEATRRALLDSAATKFLQKGYAATSLDEVAAGARVTKGAVYHHFPSKRAVYEALTEEAEQRAVAAIVEAAAEHESPWDGALAGLDAFLHLCVDPTYSRLCFQEGPTVMGFDDWWRQGETYFVALTRSMIEGLRNLGLVETEDPEILSQMLFGSVTAAALLLARSPDPEMLLPRVRSELLRFVERFRSDPPQSG